MSSSKAPAIPSVPQGLDNELVEFLTAVKIHLENLKGLGGDLNKVVTRRDLQNMGIDLKMIKSGTGRYDFESIL